MPRMTLELEAQLADAHCLLQDAHAAIDPEAWPELSARLAAALECGLPQCQHVTELTRRVKELESAIHDADQLSTDGDDGCFVPWDPWEALLSAAEGKS